MGQIKVFIQQTRDRIDEVLEPADIAGIRVVLPAVNIN